MTTMRVDDLIPYTLYTYAVAACTIAGCTLSSSSAPVRTTKACRSPLTTVDSNQEDIMQMKPLYLCFFTHWT